VRYLTTDSFRADYRKLGDEERHLLRAAIRRFNQACDAAFAHGGGRPRWPKALRVKDVEGAPGVWEMTGSSAGPDGRATWEWTTIDVDGEELPAVRWRRVGGHSIFNDP
jgi:hypothetical protein